MIAMKILWAICPFRYHKYDIYHIIYISISSKQKFNLPLVSLCQNMMVFVYVSFRKVGDNRYI